MPFRMLYRGDYDRFKVLIIKMVTLALMIKEKVDMIDKLATIDRKWFLAWQDWLIGREAIRHIMCWITKASSKVFFLTYVLGFCYLIWQKDMRLIRFLAVPALVLGMVSIARKIINRKRPFDELDITPGVAHESGGSLPSKHASSAMIIAIVFYWLNPAIGTVMIALAILTAVSRVFAGVHYPLDILSGMMVAWCVGLIFLK